MSILPDYLLPKITVRKCPVCSYVDRHPKVYCSNCGTKYEIVEMTESKYRELISEQVKQIFHGERGNKIERR
jgi:uncharacterized OB-fold protein